MLCSFLIPSRFRFDRLKQTIQSIHDISESEDFEVIVRFHADDNGSINEVAQLAAFPRTRYIVGETFDGYRSLHIFSAELIEAAKGEWCLHVNDDMTLFGKGWEERLRAMPRNALVQPELHRLNESTYLNDATGPAPCHANEQWVADFLRATGSPQVDMNLYREFVRLGRPIRFLHGIGVHHHWGGIEAHAA